VFWVRSVYFNLRNVLPTSGTFLPGHPVYTHKQTHTHTHTHTPMLPYEPIFFYCDCSKHFVSNVLKFVSVLKPPNSDAPFITSNDLNGFSF